MLVTATGIENLTRGGAEDGRRRRGGLPAVDARAAHVARRGTVDAARPRDRRRRTGRRDAGARAWPTPISTSSCSTRARRRDAARRPLARAVARRAPHLRAARRLGRARGDARRGDADRAHRHFAGRRLRTARARRRPSTTCRRWATSSAIARCRRRSTRRSRARGVVGAPRRRRSTAVGGTPAYAAVECAAAATGSRSSRGSPPSPTARGATVAGIAAPAARLRPGRAHRASCGATRRTTASRIERFTPRRPDGAAAARAITTVSSGRRRRSARRRCSRSPTRRSSRELARHFAPRAGGFARVADAPRVSARARIRDARRSARACVVLGNAAQTLHPVAGQGFNVGLRDACELAQAVLDAPRDAHRRRARCSGAMRAAAAPTAGPASRSPTASSICSATSCALVRWPRGLALTLLDALPPAKRAFTRAMLFGIALAAKANARAPPRRVAPHALRARLARNVHSRNKRPTLRNNVTGASHARGTVIIRSPPRHFPARLFRPADRAHRSVHPSEQSRRRADGGRHRSAVPPAVQALGAGYAVSEMVASNPQLRGHGEIAAAHRSSRARSRPIAVQIAGADPALMADAARYNVERGAQIIDINMGCPAKKVCNVAAGSALLANEPLVAAIVDGRRARGRRAGDAQDPHRAAIPSTATRSRSRASPRTPASRRSPCTAARAPARSSGPVEYETIRAVKAAVAHSGDRQRRHRHARAGARVLDDTGADAIMIGRAAQGRPWIFREIAHYPRARRRICRRRRSPRRARRSSRISTTTTRSTARRRACASRASISAGTRRISPAATRSAARSTPRRRRERSSRAVDRFFDTLAELGERLDYRAARADDRRRARRVRHGHDKHRFGAGRPWPREKNTAHQRRQRDRHERSRNRSTNISAGSTASRRTASTTW